MTGGAWQEVARSCSEPRIPFGGAGHGNDGARRHAVSAIDFQSLGRAHGGHQHTPRADRGFDVERSQATRVGGGRASMAGVGRDENDGEGRARAEVRDGRVAASDREHDGETTARPDDAWSHGRLEQVDVQGGAGEGRHGKNETASASLPEAVGDAAVEGKRE